MQQSETFQARSIKAVSAAAAVSFVLVVSTSYAVDDPRFSAFSTANRDAMCRMMAAMHSVGSGDVDRDFAESMIAHHAGAIEMAQAQLLFGRDVQLRRIAQEIIVKQKDEIAALRLALNDLPPARSTRAVVGPTKSGPGDHPSHR